VLENPGWVKTRPQNSTWQNRPLRGRPPEFDDEAWATPAGETPPWCSHVRGALPPSHRSTVRRVDVAAEPDVLASRVRRMSPTLASNPHRFQEDRSEIAQELPELGRRIRRRSDRSWLLVVGSASRSSAGVPLGEPPPPLRLW
jgi:hypothetical protein